MEPLQGNEAAQIRTRESLEVTRAINEEPAKEGTNAY
jgi:hypothetical protein